MKCTIKVAKNQVRFNCTVHGTVDTRGRQTLARVACRQARAVANNLCIGCYETLEEVDKDSTINEQNGKCLLCNCR